MEIIHIRELSISDLKASYDFINIELEDLKITAEEKHIAKEEITIYNEISKLRESIYEELQNRIRFLQH